MQKPSSLKYSKLADYLLNLGSNRITISFREIEQIIGEELPPTAYNHRQFWENSLSHSQAKSWLNAGYKTVEVAMGRYITFESK